MSSAIHKHEHEAREHLNAIANALDAEQYPKALRKDIERINEELDLVFDDPALREVER